MADNGPYQTGGDAAAAARAVIPPDPGWSILSPAQRHELLHRALSAASVETTAFEDRTARWLTTWEDRTVAIIAGWVARAFEAGKAAALDGAETEWAVAYRPKLAPGVPASRIVEPHSSEYVARRVVANLRAVVPEDESVVMRHQVTPWTPVDEPGSPVAGQGEDGKHDR